MVVQYHPDTDMLYIKLADGVSTESEEVAPGIVLDFDEGNRVIGIEIEDASTFIDLSRLEVVALPIANLILSGESLQRCSFEVLTSQCSGRIYRRLLGGLKHKRTGHDISKKSILVRPPVRTGEAAWRDKRRTHERPSM